eukprot:8588755-Pyramimonas_sp.AAC.2
MAVIAALWTAPMALKPLCASGCCTCMAGGGPERRRGAAPIPVLASVQSRVPPELQRAAEQDPRPDPTARDHPPLLGHVRPNLERGAR